MNGTCNIYYNRLTHKWEFYEVKDGKESLFHLLDFKGLEEGDDTKITREHFVDISNYFNISEVNINIYEDDPELIADIRSFQDKSIHIKILPNKFIHKKAKDIETLLRDCFPKITLTGLLKGKDEEDIRTLESAVSAIKSIIEEIENKASRASEIIAETQARTKDLSESNRQQYKDIISQQIYKLIQNVDLDGSVGQNVELFFNKQLSSDLKCNAKKLSEFLKTNLKTIEEFQIINTSNLTMQEIRKFARTVCISANVNPIMRSAVVTTFASSLLGICIIIIIMWRGRKHLAVKNLQIMQNFWGEFCVEFQDLMKRLSALKLICACPKEKAYDRLKEAKCIIDTLH